MNAGLKETSAPTRTAIILVNWNGARDLLECLESLLRLETRSFDVFVCDNDSSDGSVEKVVDWAANGKVVQPESAAHAHLFAKPRRFEPVVHVLDGPLSDVNALPVSKEPRIVLIRTGGNLGFAGGNNVGLRCAMRDALFSHFWLLNTDTIVTPHSLDALLERSFQRPDAGMVGSTLLYYWHPEKVQALGGASFEHRTTSTKHIGIGQSVSVSVNVDEVERQTSYVVGASMLVTRKLLENIGLMCEDYFLYYEEIDWAVRAKGSFCIAYSSESIVFHKVGGTSTKIVSAGAMRYLYKSRLIFVARHFPERFSNTIAVLVVELLRHMLKGRFQQAAALSKTLVSTRMLWRQGRDRAGHAWR